MFKKLSLTLILPSLLLADWTIGLSSNSTLKISQEYVETFPKEIQKDIFIEQVEDKYRVNYGVFSTYDDSENRMLELAQDYNYLYDMYIRKTKKKVYKEETKIEDLWTISISSMSSLNGANDIINEQIDDIKDKLYIEKYKNFYRINFDRFKTYEDAKNLQKVLSNEFSILKDGFVTKSNYKNIIKTEDYEDNRIISNTINIDKPITDENNKKVILSNSNPIDNYSANQNREEINTDRVPTVLVENDSNRTYKKEIFYSKNNSDVIIKDKKTTILIENESNKVHKDEVFYNKQDSDEVIKDRKPVRLEDNIVKNVPCCIEPYNPNKFGIDLKSISFKEYGDFKFGTLGNMINLKDDLNIKDKNITLIPEVFFKNNDYKLTFSYENYKADGKATLVSDLILDDYTYLTSDVVKTNLSTSIYNFGYRYNLLNTDLGFNLINFEKSLELNNNSNITKIDLNYNLFALGIDKDFTYDHFLTNLGFKYGLGTNIDYMNYNLGIGLRNIYINDSSLMLGYQKTKLNIKDGEIYNGTSNYDGIYIDFKKSF